MDIRDNEGRMPLVNLVSEFDKHAHTKHIFECPPQVKNPAKEGHLTCPQHMSLRLIHMSFSWHR